MRLTFLIMRRLFRQLRRDHRSLGLVLIAPAIFMVMFGIAFGGEIEHLPILIINNDSDAEVVITQTVGPFTITVFNETVPSMGNGIAEILKNDSRVDITKDTNYNTAKDDVDKKRFSAVLFIPENFTYNLVSPIGENVSLEIYLDNSNPQIGGVVLYAIQEAFQEVSGEFRGNLGLNIQYAFGENISTLDFFAPGMIAYGVFFFSFMLVIMNLIGERKSGTLSLLLQCPYDKVEIILGYLAAFSVVSMLQTTMVMLVAGIVFQVSFGSSFAHIISVYIGAVVVGWTGLILAIFLSAFARSEFQAVQFIPIVIIPVLLLSGIIIPLNQIPEVLRWVSYLVPTTYGVHLLRQISIEGVVLSPFNYDLIFQLVFFVIILMGTRLTLRET
ncbi:MAG: ABC transporter permease [Candidatus Hodarchaeales archaeon]|jgi:ABC-2 type transport system permease protein